MTAFVIAVLVVVACDVLAVVGALLIGAAVERWQGARRRPDFRLRHRGKFTRDKTESR